MYSGKHKTTGLNVQVACTITGDLAWISDPIDGSRHDTHCLNESGVVADEPGNWIGTRVMSAMTCLPRSKKSAHRDLLDCEKQFNKQINKIRYVNRPVVMHCKSKSTGRSLSGARHLAALATQVSRRRIACRNAPRVHSSCGIR